MINPQWIKVINDLWDNKARTILVVIAITVGVFTLGGVFMSQEVIMGDMASQFAEINPACIDLYVSSFDNSLVSAVKGMREVEDAAGSTSLSVKLIASDGTIYNTDLRAVEDYSQATVNQITPLEGAFPPIRRGILLERTSVEFTGAEIGDMLEIELPDGQRREIEFIGTVHDLNAFPASMWPQLTGYVSLDTLKWLGHSGSFHQLSIVAPPEVTTLREAQDLAQEIKTRVERYGYTVYNAYAIRPGEHWAEETTMGVITILSILGVFALGLSAFLVVNTITALLAQHKRQIGMMKAVGATRRQVLSTYLTMVAAFGILALVLALPLGAGLAYGTVLAVTKYLNLEIVNFHMPLWVVGLMTTAALIAPLIAGLFPIIGGTRITVREALSDYGINATKKYGVVDRLLTRLQGLPRPTMLSLRNTFRRKGRLWLTLGTLTLAGAMFISVLNVRQAMFEVLDEALKLWGYDVAFSFDNVYQARSVEREAQRVDHITDMEGIYETAADNIRADGSEGSRIWLRGVDYDSQFVQGASLVEEGRWLQPGDKNAIVISLEFIKNEPDYHVGDEITLDMQGLEHDTTWEIVGIINTLGSSSGYVNFDYLSRIDGHPGEITSFFVGIDPNDAAMQDAVAEDMEDRFKRAGIGVDYTEANHTIIEANTAQFNFLVSFLLVAAVILAIVGGIGLMGSMSLNVLERTREIGVMRSIGASTGSVRGIVVVEGLVIGAISWALSTAISLPVTYGFGIALGVAVFQFPLTFTFWPPSVLLWLPVVLLISMLSSLLPARRAARISVREALAYE
ncbi:MAG: ABC transporter permease [Anaerolineae bacterium]|nr:ABC transporter permease [Anaerolineae bacterium]